MVKRFWFVRVGWLVALAFVLFLASPTQAQDSDYSRVVRLSRTEGQVLFSHPGSDTWEEALVNLPLQEGDTLATEGGYAEIEFENGATAYLAENSVLQFTQLSFSGGGRATQLNLTQGAGTFYANLTSQDSFRVLTSTFEVAIPERAEVRVDAFRDGASVQVLTGNVSVSTSEGSTSLEKGQSVAIHQGDFQHLNIARLPNPDSFDQWVIEEGEFIRSGTKNTLSYISSPNYYGLSDLSIYGTWVNFPGYGMSWRPFNAGPSWAPCMNGIWTLDPRLGWIWVSNEPWGWMPYHFGSWLLSPTLGWVWIPGGTSGLRRWEPARVNWVHTGNRVGWVAMSPNDREGAPANLEHGVITKPGTSGRNTNDPNQMISGKELRNFTPVKQPPADLTSRPAPHEPHSGLASARPTIPQPSNGSNAIVFDRGTHTFINSDSASHAPVARLPQSNARTDNSRVTIPPPVPMDSHVNRIILPSVAPASPSRTMNSANPPARPATNPQPSQIAPPRQVTSPPASVSRPVTQPPAPPTPPATPRIGSVVQPAAPMHEPARPEAGAATPRH